MWWSFLRRGRSATHIMVRTRRQCRNVNRASIAPAKCAVYLRVLRTMLFNHLISRFTIALLLTAVIGTIDAALAQDDVVRINTELVQTAITVVNKKGKFVEGLNRGDFELLIDGKPRSCF